MEEKIEVVEKVNINPPKASQPSPLRRKLLMTGFILIVLVIALYFFTSWFSKTTGFSVGENQLDNLINCLNEKGAVLYISDTCPDCEKQRELFGESYKNLDVFNCALDQDFCLLEKDLKAVPAWEIERTQHYGFLSLADLEDRSGCQIS